MLLVGLANVFLGQLCRLHFFFWNEVSDHFFFVFHLVPVGIHDVLRSTRQSVVLVFGVGRHVATGPFVFVGHKFILGRPCEDLFWVACRRTWREPSECWRLYCVLLNPFPHKYRICRFRRSTKLFFSSVWIDWRSAPWAFFCF